MFYTQIIGVPAPMVGLALTLALVIDAISDPIVGYWSDNFRSKWGRRHPFMYASAIPVAVSYFLLWTPPRDWDANALFWYRAGHGRADTHGAHLLRNAERRARSGADARLCRSARPCSSWRSFFGWTGGNAMTVMMFFFVFPAFATPEIPNGQFNRDAYAVYALGVGRRDADRHHGVVARHAPADRQAGRAAEQRKMSLGGVFSEMFETLANKSMGAIFLTAIIANTTLGMGQALSAYMSTFFWKLRPEQIGVITLVIFVSAALGAAPRNAADPALRQEESAHHCRHHRPDAISHRGPAAPERRADTGNGRGLLGCAGAGAGGCDPAGLPAGACWSP